jgi:MFS family permease
MKQFAKTFGNLSPTVQGLVVSSILIPAALASIVAGPLSDRISRTRTFTIGGAVFALGAALESASSHIAMLIIGRCLSGVGEGIFLSILTVYICEIAPTAIRGRLSCTVQLFITFGITSGTHSSVYFYLLSSRCAFRIFCMLRIRSHSKLLCLAMSVCYSSNRRNDIRYRLVLPPTLS